MKRMSISELKMDTPITGDNSMDNIVNNLKEDIASNPVNTNEIKQKVKNTIDVVMAVASCIKEIKRIPSGHLYAQMMSKIDISTYESIIDFLERSNLITIKNNELIWKD